MVVVRVEGVNKRSFTSTASQVISLFINVQCLFFSVKMIGLDFVLSGNKTPKIRNSDPRTAWTILGLAKLSIDRKSSSPTVIKVILKT